MITTETELRERRGRRTGKSGKLKVVRSLLGNQILR